MRSTLFTIPYEVGGVPLFGVGVLLALWAVVAVFLLYRHVRSRGWDQEIVGQLLSLGFVGAAILFLPRFFEDGLPIRGYGLMVLLGATGGIALAARRGEQVGISGEKIVSLCIWMIVAGIAGARLFYVIQYWPRFQAETLAGTLKNVVSYPQGGLVVYGGLIAGAGALFWFLLRHRMPILKTGDVIVPGVALGIALGRVGCFLNGCCYGGVCEQPWAVTFPGPEDRPGGSPPYSHQVDVGLMHGFQLSADPEADPLVLRVHPDSPASSAGLQSGANIAGINGYPVNKTGDAMGRIHAAYQDGNGLDLQLGEGSEVSIPAVEKRSRSLAVHPTQLYSAVQAGLLAWLLWAWFPFRKHDGEVAAMALMLYPLGRFLLEGIRSDEPSRWGSGLTISQIVSLLIFAIGMVMLVALRWRGQESGAGGAGNRAAA